MQDPQDAIADLHSTHQLGAMRLSPNEQRLYGEGDTQIAIERKAFDLLCFLVEQRHRVVSKDELLQQVWGRSIASDSVIAQAVSKARKALVAGGGESEWIDVARAVGYRYVGPAVALPELPLAEPANVRSARPRIRLQAAWIALVLSIGIVVGAWWQSQTALRDPMRVAVLPWRDDTGDEALKWSSLGLQGLLVDALANDRRLATVPQASVRALLAARPELVDAQAQADYLAAATGARHVYAGRLARAGQGVVVELALLGESSGASMRLEGDSPAMLALAAGTGATQSLLPGFDPARPQALSAIAFANEAYARGVDARLRGRAEEAAQHLRSALGADPAMLAARYQLSLALQLLRQNDDWKAALDTLLEEAHTRGDRLHQGLALSGLAIHAWREARYADAQSLLAESARLFDSPADTLRLASTAANLGSLAAIQGRFEEAESEMWRALEAFESAGQQVEVARISKNLGVMNIDRGQFARGRALFERSLAVRQSLGLERDLAETLVSLGTADIGMESPEAAEASLARAAEIFARYKDPLMESEALARLAVAQSTQGRLRDAGQSAGRSLAAARSAGNIAARGFAHLQIARVEAKRGDPERARAELAQAQALLESSEDRKLQTSITLEQLELEIESPTPELRERLDQAVIEARERGWRALESEAQVLRARMNHAGQPQAAAVDLQSAYALAIQVGEPALITHTACHWAIAVASESLAAELPRPRASESAEAVATCTSAAPRNAMAARFRAQTAERSGDPEQALAWAKRRKQLLGEAWSLADEAELQRLATVGR